MGGLPSYWWALALSSLIWCFVSALLMSDADFSPLLPYIPQVVEDIEAVEAFRVEVETPKVGTGFALIRKYPSYFVGSRSWD